MLSSSALSMSWSGGEMGEVMKAWVAWIGGLEVVGQAALMLRKCKEKMQWFRILGLDMLF
jgi:hypothetical protein